MVFNMMTTLPLKLIFNILMDESISNEIKAEIAANIHTTKWNLQIGIFDYFLGEELTEENYSKLLESLKLKNPPAFEKLTNLFGTSFWILEGFDR